MELHLALKNIVNLSGTSILKEQRLVNILADFNAYDDVPSAKYIIKTIIDEGYMDKLLVNGKWDLNCDKLIDQFAAMTGMVKDNVSYVFESVCVSLGWLQSVKTSIHNNSTCKINTMNSYGNSDIKSVVEVHNGQNLNGIVLSNPTADVIGKNKIVVGCEVSGTLNAAYVEIHCTIYKKNALYSSKEIGCVFKDRYSGFCIVSDTFDLKGAIGDVSRIVFYIR